MKTNKRLKLASSFLKFIMSFSLIFAIIFSYIFFDSVLSPEKYSKLIVKNGKDLSYSFNNEIKTPKTYTEWSSSKQIFHYNLLDNYSKFRIIFPLVLNLITFSLIIFLFNRFLKNTTNYDVFFKENIKVLNKIVKLILFLFILNFLNQTLNNMITMIFEDNGLPKYVISYNKGHLNLNLFIRYPIAIIFFLTLKEVFRRGQELKEENDLTI